MFVLGVLGWFENTRVALVVGAVWLVLLLLAYQFAVGAAGKRRADLVDETGALEVQAPEPTPEQTPEVKGTSRD